MFQNMKVEVNSKNVAALLCLLGLIVPAYSIQCYECNSESNAACLAEDGAEIPKTFLKNCSEYGNITGFAFDACRIIIQDINWGYKIPGRDCPPGNRHRVIRTCGMLQPPADVPGKCFWRGGSGTKSHYCVCDKDACNSASVSGAWPLGIVILMASWGHSLLS